MLVIKRKYRQFSLIEEEVIRMSLARHMTIEAIAASMPKRSIQSIRTKIYSMGLASPSIMRFDSYYRRITKQKEKSMPFMMQGEKGDRWQIALALTKAKLIDFGGIKTYCINGVPVSIFKIMRIYNSLNLGDRFPI